MSIIKKVEFLLKTYSYYKPFHIKGGISAQSTDIEVKIKCEDGTIGFGEASPSFRVNGEKPEMIMTMEDFCQQTLIGQNVKEYRKIFQITDKLFAVPSLKAAIQYAVLDAFASYCQMEVYQILGGATKSIKTDKTVGIETLDNRIKEVKDIVGQGFDVIKIKVGEDVKQDIEFMTSIKDLIKDKKIIVDANMGYSVKEAINFANSTYKAGIDIDVFEQPVYMTDFEGLKSVRYNCPFSVAADESAKTKFDVFRLLKDDAVDYINIKLMKSGISDALSIVEIVKSSNKKLMIGCMGESSLGINQSVHFALGTGAFDFCDLDSHLMIKEEEFRGKFKQKGDEIFVD